MEEIKNRLNVRGGPDKVGQGLAPNQSAKFMIVFGKIPPDLAEYSVEPVGSQPMEKKK